MPPLQRADIPDIKIIKSDDDSPRVKIKADGETPRQGRAYDEGPIPVKLSDHAPRQAKITGRVFDDKGCWYSLRIGDVELPEIGLDEILDYVSPRELEDFETRKFAEEEVVLRVAESEARRAEEDERLQEQMIKVARAERARTIGTVAFGSTGESDENDVISANEIPVPLGRNGRPRPTYKHLYLQPTGRQQRRRRDPETGELIPLSHDESAHVAENSSDDEITRQDMPLGATKGRRRKRDKLTGELLPLSPLQDRQSEERTKRPRRRRHPVTGELMPLGWRYDGNVESKHIPYPQSGPDSPSFGRLSISSERDAKRQRMDDKVVLQRTSAEIEDSSSQHGLNKSSNRIKPESPQHAARTPQKLVVDIVDSDEDSENLPELLFPERQGTSSVLELFKRGQLVDTKSPKPIRDVPLVPKARTSITNPSAEVVDLLTSEDEQSGNESEEEDFDIEAILQHGMSNPSANPEGSADKPIMMYLVKWAGYSKPTWEPVESFGDLAFVNDYRRREGLDILVDNRNHELQDDNGDVTAKEKDKPNAKAVLLPASAGQTSRIFDATLKDHPNGDSTSESNGPDEYEVESIVAHCSSDPKTHPPGYGENSIMLYQVKWKGFSEMTWEPAESFEDLDMLWRYRAQKGLKG